VTLDLTALKDIAPNTPEALPRQTAYAERSLGRVLLARGELEEAAECFGRSARLFEAVKDGISEFYALVGETQSLLNLKSFPTATEALSKAEELLKGRSDRQREHAIIKSLRACLVWRKDEDFAESLSLSRQAHSVLEEEPDYYLVRALLIQAEIQEGAGDLAEARRLAADARTLSAALSLGFAEREASNFLARLGVPEMEIRNIAKSNIQRLAERQMLVRDELTILYADLRDFTSICMQVEPGIMGEFIADFAELISKSVEARRGLPVRFLGDCVMAVFGVKGEKKEKEMIAFRAAREIYERFRTLRERWEESVGLLGSIGLGFAMATGEVIAGDFGSSDLNEFSVIGDPVNMSARLQGHAVDGEIILCRKTLGSIKDRLVEVGLEEAKRKVELKGIGEMEVSVWKINGAYA